MKVLLATDGSSHSDRAVKMALNVGVPAFSEIRVVFVVETILPVNLDIYGGAYTPQTVEFEKIAREKASKVLEATRQELLDKLPAGNVAVTTEILVGSAESQIVETAEKMNADLIIVGSHGYNSWERLLLGSVSDSIVHHAPCSVLVVREQKA